MYGGDIAFYAILVSAIITATSERKAMQIELRNFIGEFCPGSITIPILISDENKGEIAEEVLGEWILEGEVVPIRLKQAKTIFSNYFSDKNIVGISWTGECNTCKERHLYWLREVLETKSSRQVI